MLASDKTRYFSLFILVLMLVTVIFPSNQMTLAQSKSNRKSTKTATRETLTAINTIPYSLDVTEESTKKGLIITLAVDQVTIIRCPEEALQILFGNSEGIDVSETKPGRTEVYLRPRLSSINTNVVIEMASGPVMLYLRTIEIKGGAKIGQFTAEVMIKNSAYKEALIKAKDELEVAKKEIGELETKVTELTNDLKTKEFTNCQEKKEDLLRLIENTQQFSQRVNVVQALSGKVRISQIGRLQAVKAGFIVSVAIENKTNGFISIDSVNAQSFALLTTFVGNSRKIAAKSELKLSFLIETNSNTSTLDTVNISNTENKVEAEQNIPRELTIVINQTPITLKIN